VADPERAEEWGGLEWEVVEEEWAVPVPEWDQEEGVSARPVELLPPISRESPVPRPDAPNAGQLWCGRKSGGKLVKHCSKIHFYLFMLKKLNIHHEVHEE